MNYDDDHLGTNNPIHPANEIEVNLDFDSTDLQECMDHYKKTGDIGFLENAIDVNRKKLEDAVLELLYLRTYLYTIDKEYEYRKIQSIIKILNS